MMIFRRSLIALVLAGLLQWVGGISGNGVTLGIGVARAEPAAVRFGKHENFGRMVIEAMGIENTTVQHGDDRVTLTFGRDLRVETPARPKALDAWVASIQQHNADRLDFQLTPGVAVKIQTWTPGQIIVDFTKPGQIGGHPAGPKINIRSGKHAAFSRLVLESDQPFVLSDQPALIEGQSAGSNITLHVERSIAQFRTTMIKQLKPYVQTATIQGSSLTLTLAPDVMILRKERLSKKQYIIDFASASEQSAQVGEPETVLPRPVPLDFDQQPSDGAPLDILVETPDRHLVWQDSAVREKWQARLNDRCIDHGFSPVGAGHDGADIETDAQGESLDQPEPDALKLAFEALDEADAFILRLASDHPQSSAFYVRGKQFWVVLDGRSQGINVQHDTIPAAVSRTVRTIRSVPHQSATILRMQLAATPDILIARSDNIWCALFVPHQTGALRAASVAGERAMFSNIARVISFSDPIVGDDVHVAMSAVLDAGKMASRSANATFLQSYQGAAWTSLADGVSSELVDGHLSFSRPGGLILQDRHRRKHHLIDTGSSISPEKATVEQDPVQHAKLSLDPSIDHQKIVDPAAQPAGLADDAAKKDVLGDGGLSETAPDKPGLSDHAGASNMHAAHDVRAEESAALEDDGVQKSETDNIYGAPIGLIDWQEGLSNVPMSLSGRPLPPIMDDPRLDPGHQIFEQSRGYLSKGFGAESLTVLDFLEGIDREGHPHADDLADVEASIRGAANYLMGRITVAEKLLSSPALAESDEVTLWKIAIDTENKKWQIDRQQALDLVDILNRYPPKLKVRLGLAVAMNALEAGFADPAYVILNELQNQPLEDEDREAVILLSSLVLERDGGVDESLASIAELKNSQSHDMAVHAAYLETLIKNRNDIIDLDQAIGDLRDQSIFWRGHRLAPEMFENLGRLVVASGEVLNGLAIWENLIRRGDPVDDPARLAAKIAKVASEHLVNDDFSQNALRGLALLNQFGDTISDREARRQIVDRLALDLAMTGFPDTAARLLSDERNNVLGGGDTLGRVLVANQQLEAGNPEAVFSTLPFDDAAIPVEARARLELGESEKARALFRRDGDPASLSGVVDSYWFERDFARIRAFGRSDSTDRETIIEADDSERRTVPQIMTAQVEQGDFAQLLQLATDPKRNAEITGSDDWYALLQAGSPIEGDADLVMEQVTQSLTAARQGLEALRNLPRLR